MSADRQYTDEEVALILRKATDLQAQGANRGEGLDLETIQDIAREIGLDPELVAQAATQLPIDSPGALARFFGGGALYQVRLTQDGEISPEKAQELVAIARRLLGHQGVTTEVMGSMEWKTVGEPSQLAVTISKRAGSTSVEIIADRGGAAVLTGVGSMSIGILAGVVTGAITEPGVAVGMTLFGSGVAGGLLLTRVIWRRNTAKFKNKLNALTEALRQALHL